MQEIEVEQIKEILEQHNYEYKSNLEEIGLPDFFLCQNKRTQHLFAAKKSLKLQMIEDEYKSLVTLDHPYIIKLYDSFDDEIYEYLIMEYCSNGTIEQKGKLTYDKFVHYSKQILEAISFIHSKKIAHRDIRPENIFIDQYDHVKLSNFGMAKEFQYDEKIHEKYGSYTQFAPEMIQNHEICPFKADIWALGITFFYMATGLFPFKSNSLEKTNQMIVRGDINYSEYNIHPKIRFLLTKMLAKDKDHRLTAEKLLELPIFCSTKSKLPLLLIEKKQIKPEYPTSLSNDMHRINNFARCNTYRGACLYPMIPRSNNRFPLIKTF